MGNGFKGHFHTRLPMVSFADSAPIISDKLVTHILEETRENENNDFLNNRRFI